MLLVNILQQIIIVTTITIAIITTSVNRNISMTISTINTTIVSITILAMLSCHTGW